MNIIQPVLSMSVLNTVAMCAHIVLLQATYSYVHTMSIVSSAFDKFIGCHTSS